MLSKEIWFIYERVEIDLPRTTDTVEGWHKLFQHTMGYAHPNNYKLIELVKLKQCYSRNREAKIDAGPNVPKIQKCIYVSGPQRLLKNFHHQDPMDYLQSILYNIDRIYTSNVIFCLFYFSKLADI